MSAANIRYIISGLELKMNKTDTASTPMGLKEVYRGQTAIVYRNDAALERAYIVPNVQVIPVTDSALKFMKSSAFNPHSVAVVDRAIGTALPASVLVQSSSIKVHEPDRVVVHTTTNQPALLVLADVYANGWKAWVDDKPANIVIANVAFRGVVIPAGDHDVRFSFDPDRLITGLWISSILFALLMVYTIVYIVMRTRRSAVDESAAA
jgi:Predicted membrane protein